MIEKRRWGRRTFMKMAGKGLASLPLLASLPEDLSAQHTQSKHEARPAAAPGPPSKVRLNVRELGAAGDGKTKDTLALQQALDRCSVLGGGEVVVPAGEYLTGALILRSNTALRLEENAALLGSPDIADYPLAQVRWEGHWIKGYTALISAQDAAHVTIQGKGKIVASPAIKGRVVRPDGSQVTRPMGPVSPDGPTGVARQNILRNPALLEFTNCRNVRVQDCFTQGNDMWSTHPVYCEDVVFQNVIVRSGADGIDVDSCKGVVIDGCEFQTRDDCISLKSGRGEEGNTIGRPCEDVRISNCTFNDSYWACIGIGSETSGGIRNVHVEHCRCVGARTFAIYIKSRPGRGAYIQDIYMNDLDVSGAQQGFLRINDLNSGLKDLFPVPGGAGIPTMRNFRFSNIRVKDVPVLVDAASVHPDKPLDGFSLVNVTGTCGKGILLANMHHVVLRDIHVTGFTGPLLSTHNVTGSGLSEAVPLTEARLPDPILPANQPYVLR